MDSLRVLPFPTITTFVGTYGFFPAVTGGVADVVVFFL